jgi:hypothetical protein
MRGPSGCLTKLFLILLAAVVFVWAVLAALNPWALHIGGRSTPLLYWHGTGVLVSKDGKTYPLYLTFYPGRSRGSHAGGRREGKPVSGRLQGDAWLCIAPGKTERMKLSGTKYGGYASTDGSLFDFRLLEWGKPFSMNPQNRGFFDLAGEFHGPDLVMDRPGEQGVRLHTGPFIDNATATLHWADRQVFEINCRESGISNSR